MWLRDSHFKFLQKVAMISILIYIFFIFSSLFRFFICDYVIPVSPVTPSLKSSPEKGLIFELWLRDSHFNLHLKIAMLFILIYIFFIFSYFLDFSFVTTWSLCPPWLPIQILFYSLSFLCFLDFSFVTTWSPCPLWLPI